MRHSQVLYDGANIPATKTPTINGVGEVWVDTQYEESASKGAANPSTITVVDAAGANTVEDQAKNCASRPEDE